MRMVEVSGGHFTGRVIMFPAYKGPFIVDPAKIVFCQVSAFGFDLEVPLFLFDEYGYVFMAQEPSDILEVVFGPGGIDLEGKITATFGLACLTRHFCRFSRLCVVGPRGRSQSYM
jgi:hypothetical protein